MVLDGCLGQLPAFAVKNDLLRLALWLPRLINYLPYNLFEPVLQICIEGLHVVTRMLLVGVVVVCRVGIIKRLVLLVIAYSTHRAGSLMGTKKVSWRGLGRGLDVLGGSLQRPPDR